MNKKKIIEKGNKKLNRLTGDVAFHRLRARGIEMYFSFVVMRNLKVFEECEHDGVGSGLARVCDLVTTVPV